MTRRGPRSAARAVLVTGGARRLGAAIARRLALGGFSVVVTYRESRAEAEGLAAEIGGTACFLDLESLRGLSRIAGIVERTFGRLDLLVHNAAVFSRTPVGSVTDRDWDRIFAVNVRGPFLLTQRLLPLLRAPRGGGAILFVGDAGARQMWPGYLPYCLSKLALEAQAVAQSPLEIFGQALADNDRVRVGLELVKTGRAAGDPARPGYRLPPAECPEARRRRQRRSPARGFRRRW